MAIHSSILAWKIPWTEEPDGLQSMGVTKTQMWLNTAQFTVTWAPTSYLSSSLSMAPQPEQSLDHQWFIHNDHHMTTTIYQFFHVCTVPHPFDVLILLTGLDSILNHNNYIALYTIDALALLSFAQTSLVKPQSWLNPALFLLRLCSWIWLEKNTQPRRLVTL